MSSFFSHHNAVHPLPHSPPPPIQGPSSTLSTTRGPSSSLDRPPPPSSAFLGALPPSHPPDALVASSTASPFPLSAHPLQALSAHHTRAASIQTATSQVLHRRNPSSQQRLLDDSGARTLLMGVRKVELEESKEPDVPLSPVQARLKLPSLTPRPLSSTLPTLTPLPPLSTIALRPLPDPALSPESSASAHSESPLLPNQMDSPDPIDSSHSPLGRTASGVSAASGLPHPPSSSPLSTAAQPLPASSKSSASGSSSAAPSATSTFTGPPAEKGGEPRHSLYTSSLRRVSLTSEYDKDEAADGDTVPGLGSSTTPGSTTSASVPLLLTHHSTSALSLLLHALEGHWLYRVYLTLCILYVFFADDVRLASPTWSASSDAGVLAGYVLCLFSIGGDLLLRALTSASYCRSPLFALEAVGTLLIILWMPPVWGPSGVGEVWLSSAQGRAVLLSCTLPLMCRLIGVWSLDAWVKKVYRAWEEVGRLKGEQEEEREEREEGRRIRTQLAQHTSLTVVCGAICMLLLAAFLDYSWNDRPYASTAELLMEQLSLGNAEQGQAEANFQAFWGDELLYMSINGTVVVDNAQQLAALRPEEVALYSFNPATSPWAPPVSNAFVLRPVIVGLAWYDPTLSSQALTNVYRTLLVLGAILVTFAFAAFGAHSVIVPLERTVQAVNNLIADPLADLVRMNGKRPTARSKGPMNETQLVSSTLLKLARLLQVGFGDAGAEIIAKNLHGNLSFLDPMIPGRKIFGIFGFCSLSHFELCTEVLEEEVMVFVNQVAEIIHGVCHRHGGQVNRSLGPSFLLVWKLRTDRAGAEGAHRGGGEKSVNAAGAGEEKSVNVSVQGQQHTRTASRFLRTRKGSTSSSSVHPTPLSPPGGAPSHPHRHTYSLTRTSIKPTWSIFDRERRRNKEGMGKIDEQEEMERAKERERAKRRGMKVGGGGGGGGAEVSAKAPIDPDHVRSVSFDPHSLYSPYSREEPQSAQLDTDDEEKDEGVAGSAPLGHRASRRVGTGRILRRFRTDQSVDAESSTRTQIDEVEEDDDGAAQHPKDDEDDPHPHPLIAPDAHRAEVKDDPNRRVHDHHRLSVNAPLLPPSDSPSSPLTAPPAHFVDPSHPRIPFPLATAPASPGVKVSSHRRHSLEGSPRVVAAAASLRRVGLSGLARAELSPVPDNSDPASGEGRERRSQFRRHSLAHPPGYAVDSDKSPEPQPAAVSAGLGVVNPPPRRSHDGVRPPSIIIPSSSFSAARLRPSSPPPLSGGQPHSALSPAPYSASLPASSLPSAMRLQKDGSHPHRLHVREFSATAAPFAPPQSPTGASASHLLPAVRQHSPKSHQRSFSALPSRPGTANPNRRSSHMPVHRTSTLSLSKLSDQALIAFLHTTMSILTAPSLGRWRKHPKMMARLPSFSVSVSFGLHVGWAIEGAIGSVCKIDASYLSPHVNSSSRLMMACKQYHVSMLMSEQFYVLLHPAIRTRCRHIDRVLLKGVADPINVYTFDIAVKDKEMKSKVIKSFIEDSDEGADKREEDRSNMNRLSAYVLSLFTSASSSSQSSTQSADSAASAVHSDDVVNSRLFSALSALQSGLPVNFIPVYNRAVSSYLEGEWGAAKEALYSVMEMMPDDESAMTLFRFMEGEQNEWKEKAKRKSGSLEHRPHGSGPHDEDDASARQFEEAQANTAGLGKERAPGNWKGYRELKKK